jgi:hypothetical protein
MDDGILNRGGARRKPCRGWARAASGAGRVMARNDPSPIVREAATAALARHGGDGDPGSDSVQ